MMSSPNPSSTYPLTQSGIYRNLPSFDPTLRDLTAVVPGATGISGWNTIRSLLDSQRWTKIYALSRKPPSSQMWALIPSDQQSRVQHLPLDLMGDVKKLAEILSNIKDPNIYIFFYAYIQPRVEGNEKTWGNVDKLLEVNEKLFSNFLSALPLANIQPKRFLLQTGGKNYGIQLGRARLPCVESDPQPRHLGSNFYYAQEDLLKSYCKEHPETAWNVIRPFWVIGAVPNAQMNGTYLLAVYAAVQAYKNEPMYFCGGWDAWQCAAPMSTARLTGYLTEWAALEDSCKNEAFNSEDGTMLSFDHLFHEFARWYGVEKGVVGPPEKESNMTVDEIPGGKNSPMGHGPPIKSYSSFKMADWANKPVNQEAWKAIMKSSNGEITENPLEGDAVDETFQFLDIGLSITSTVSMNKAKRMGWTGYVDNLESTFESLNEMAGLGLLPKTKVPEAAPLV